MSFFTILNAAANGGTGSGNPTLDLVGTFLPLILLFGVFYFFLIRPQKKQQKDHDSLVATVAEGDSVLTSSGFYGVVLDVQEDIVIVEFGNNKNCRIPMKKEAILEVEKAEQFEK